MSGGEAPDISWCVLYRAGCPEHFWNRNTPDRFLGQMHIDKEPMYFVRLRKLINRQREDFRELERDVRITVHGASHQAAALMEEIATELSGSDVADGGAVKPLLSSSSSQMISTLETQLARLEDAQKREELENGEILALLSASRPKLA